MNKNLKRIFLLSIIVLLLLGVSYATEASNETTDTHEVVKDTDTMDIADSSIKEEITDNKKITKQKLEDKTTKTSSKSYNVTNFDTLNSVLTSDEYDTVTVNIKSNINLTSSTTPNNAIKTIKINGNGKTINGNNEYQFIQISSDSDTTMTINNLRIINCYSSYGAIEKNGGTLIVKNSKFINNTATSNGGAIENYGGENLTISNTTFTNNHANNNGGAIRSRTTLIITNSIFENNTSNSNGGAIANEDNLVTIDNCKFNGNSAEGYGNTIYVSDTTEIKNSEIKDCSEEESDSVYGNGDTTLINTTINKKNQTKITLKVSNTTPQLLDNITITATLTDMNNTKLTNQSIILTINDNQYSLKTNSKGTATRTYTITSSGTLNIKAKYSGNSTHSSCSATMNITVPIFNKIYNVTNFETMETALTSSVYDTVTVNMKSNINLTSSISLNSAIKTIKIYGNGKTINGNNEYQFIKIGSDTTMTISNIIIVNCNSSYGALEKNSGTVTIKNSKFINNTATSNGGAIENYGGGNLTISNTTFTNNHADGNGGAIRSRTTLIITNSIFENNTSNSNGGAIANEDNLVKINKCQFIDNSADGYGNTIYVSDTTTIRNSQINDASEYDSNCVYDKGDTSITNTTINNRTQTKITLKISNSTPNIYDTIKISATLTDMNDNKLTNQSIILTINDKQYSLKTNSKGIATRNYTITSGGTYNITAKHPVTSFYSNSSATKRINVPKINTNLTLKVSNSTPNINKQIKVTATLTDSFDKNVSNQNITLTINNENHIIKTNANGVATYNYVADTLGNIKITGKFNGTTDTYNSSSASKTINVKGKYNTKLDLKVSDLAPVVNDTIMINALLTNQKNTKLANQTVILTVNDKNYTLISHSNGTVSKSLKMTKIGTNTITLKYDGNTTNKASTSTISIFVRSKTGTNSKVKTIATLNTSDSTPGLTENVTLTVKLTDINKNGLEKQNVTFHINNKNYTLTTDANGVATRNYTPTKVGNTTITVTYDGNNVYYSTNASTTLSHGNIYVTSNGTSNGRTRDNPTNITHALEIVNNNEIINLISDTGNDTYNSCISISYSTVKEDTSKFTITGEKNREIIFTKRLSSSSIDLTLKNIVFKGEESGVEGSYLTVKNCTFIGCEDSAINVWGSATIENNKFLNNRASCGGAIYVDASNVKINKNTFKNNSATNGGAIYVYREEECTITNNKFIENRATNRGGAIELYGSSYNIIEGNSFQANEASYGGAVDNYRIYESYTYSYTYYTTESRVESYWNPMHHQIIGSTTPIYGYSGGILTVIGYQYNYIWVGQTEYRTVQVQVPHTETRTGYRYLGTDNAITNNTFVINSANTGGAAINTNTSDTTINNNTFKMNYADTTGKAIINNTETTISNNTNDKTSVYSSTIYNRGYDTVIANNTFDDGTATTLYIYPRSGDKKGTTIKISGKLLTTDNKGIKEQTIQIKVNKKTYTATTLTSGYFTINHTITDYNDLQVTFTYKGNTKYSKSTNTTTFTVQKPTTIYIYTQTGLKKGTTVKISGKLLNSDNTGVKGQTIQIKVNNKTYTATTLTSGYFTINHTITDYNDLEVSFSYAGNDNYEAITNTTTFTVQKPTTLYMYPRSGDKQGTTIKVSGKLLTSNDTGVKGQTIQIKVNDKTYTATTLTSGYFTINHTITDSNDLQVTFTYNGNTNYEAVTNSTTYEVVAKTE